MSEEQPTVQSSKEDVWYLKSIVFGYGEARKYVKIITQNFNGPCSFIAICNILILRGNIEILPPSRTTVSYEFLAQLVGDYLVTNCPGVDIGAALSVMPYTQKGMDLNPLFTGATAFRPAGEGGELKLFEHVGIKLVHGWLVDPASPEATVMCKVEDYDSAVNLIVDADHTSKGRLVVSDDAVEAGPSSPTTNWTEEERIKIEDAIVARRFLDATWSQLTYHGLFELATTLEPGSLVALFRSSHLSVLYKSLGDEAALYTLVTDQSFLNEPSVVWEKLEDVDGGGSTFVDSDFVPSSPAGGDFAGQTAEEALRAVEDEAAQFAVVDPADRALAQQLQEEEDEHARQERARYREERERQRQAEAQRHQAVYDRRQQSEDQRTHKLKLKKEKSCIIM